MPIFANDWPLRRGQYRSTHEPRKLPMEVTSKNPNHVTVTVDPLGKVACDPDPLPADGRDIHLKFVLNTAGYVFPQDAAVVVSNPGVEFPEPSRTLPPNDTQATLFDRNTQKGSFKYTVTVQQVATGNLIEYDPTIDNGP